MQVFKPKAPVIAKSKAGTELKIATNFKYLGAWMENTEKYVAVRKMLAWCECHKLKKVWTSNISRKLKSKLFLATVESFMELKHGH